MERVFALGSRALAGPSLVAWPGLGELALARLESRIAFVDHVYAPPPPDDAAQPVAVFGGL